MTYELEGSIKLIGDTASFGAKGFTKREIVITTTDRYPQDIKLEFVKEKTELLDKFRVGQDVKVGFDIRGNEFNGKYYVSLTGWKIDSAAAGGGGGEPARASAPASRSGGGQPAAKPAFSEEDFNQASKEDEYPF